MIARWLDETLGSKEGRLLFGAVVIETAATVTSYFLVTSMLDGAWDSKPGWAFFVGYMIWTLPVSTWIGILGPGTDIDHSVSSYLGPALIVAGLTGIGVFAAGLVVDIFDCGAGSLGAPDSGIDTSGCVRAFPGMTTFLAGLAVLVVIPSIGFCSVVIGFATAKIWRLLD